MSMPYYHCNSHRIVLLFISVDQTPHSCLAPSRLRLSHPSFLEALRRVLLDQTIGRDVKWIAQPSDIMGQWWTIYLDISLPAQVQRCRFNVAVSALHVPNSHLETAR
jgi:hypothetical protein